MPLPLLTAYSRMASRIEAGEALLAAATASIPFMQANDRRTQLRAWRDEAAGGRSARPISRQELLARVAESGIGVKRVQR